MGLDTWHVTGSGFDCSAVNEKVFGKFLLDHAAVFRSKFDSSDYILAVARALFEGKQTAAFHRERVFADLAALREMTDHYSLAEFVACVMTAETGIRFYVPGPTDEGADYVLFCNAAPWEYNEAERSLTEENLTKIFITYADMLKVNYHSWIDLVYSV